MFQARLHEKAAEHSSRNIWTRRGQYLQAGSHDDVHRGKGHAKFRWSFYINFLALVLVHRILPGGITRGSARLIHTYLGRTHQPRADYRPNYMLIRRVINSSILWEYGDAGQVLLSFIFDFYMNLNLTCTSPHVFLESKCEYIDTTVTCTLVPGIKESSRTTCVWRHPWAARDAKRLPVISHATKVDE